MTKLPQRPEQHVIGDRAITIVKKSLPREWIVREERPDYGIDLEVELASHEVSGRLFKAQVRGHETIKWRSDGSFSQPVREETLNYWRELPLPVVLFVSAVHAETTYWAPGKVPRGSSAVIVSKPLSLPSTARQLEQYVVDWLDQRGVRALKYSLPIFSQEWDRLLEYVGGDFHLPVDDRERYVLIEHLYRQTQLIRDALGLPSTMFPWSLWPARSRFRFGDSYEMYNAIFDEIVEYLTPLYEELIEVGKNEIRGEEPSADNAAAQYWASDFEEHYRFLTGFDSESPTFWKRIDTRLEEHRRRSEVPGRKSHLVIERRKP
ncbi:MAG: DUF4365 domain-containing protein [Gaiellaceae bacterium]